MLLPIMMPNLLPATGNTLTFSPKEYAKLLGQGQASPLISSYLNTMTESSPSAITLMLDGKRMREGRKNT